MGILANYTYVDSTADYNFSGTTVTERLLGLSNGQYNATLYYDDSKFNARFSLAYRSDYLIDGPNRAGNLWEYVESETRLDFASGYNVHGPAEAQLRGAQSPGHALSPPRSTSMPSGASSTTRRDAPSC